MVDAGGQDSEALRSAMTVATHMLLPFRPKRRDLKTLLNVSQLVKLAKAVNPEMHVRAVITQCPTLPSQVQRILDAKDACQSFGIDPLQSITCNRNVYDDADENGSSVLEVETDFKAKEEIESLVIEFLVTNTDGDKTSGFVTSVFVRLKMAGLKGLKKGDRPDLEAKAEGFISGAKERVDALSVISADIQAETKERSRVFERYTFSLNPTVSAAIDTISLVP